MSFPVEMLTQFNPSLQESKEGLELLRIAIENAGYTGKVSSPPPPLT